MNTPQTIDELSAEAALNWVDNLLYSAKGYRLNDLERQIFLGSWQGQTYEEIYPLNPQYVEKSVGYKLWRKLSAVLAEKVSKKRIRGAVVRHMRYSEERPLPQPGPGLERQPCRRIRITYHSPSLIAQQLAQELKKLLQSVGHQVWIDDPGLTSSIAESYEASIPKWDWTLLINPIE